MKTNTFQTLSAANLETVTGAGDFKAPLSGNVTQNIVGWGATQIVNEAPKAPKPTNSLVEFMRTHPEARLQQSQALSRRVGGFHGF